MADIEFTSDIKIDTKEAERSIANLSQQIDKVFAKTKEMMNKAIKTNAFGFSNITGNYWAGIQAIDDIIDLHTPNQLGNKPTKAQKAAYTAKMRAVQNAINQRNEFYRVANLMDRLSQYDNVYGDIVGLRKDVVAGKLDSEKALGRGNVKHRFVSDIVNTLYAIRKSYPDIVTEDALEIAEKHRDRNNKTKAQSRSELRYIQDKEYWRKAYDRARDYMLLDSGDTMLDQLNNIYDMGMKPSRKTKPSTVNQKAKELLTAWAEKGISAQHHKEALDAGNLTKADKAYHFEWYKKDMNEFIRLQKKLFPEEKTIAENLKKMNAANLTRWQDNGLLRFLKGAGILGMGTKILQDGSQMLESYWGERVTRSTYASKQAYYKRWEVGGQAAGLAAGAGLGFAVAGPVGAAVGAALGAIIGPLYGKFKENETKANIASANDMIGRVRNRALYGGGYNSWFAAGMDSIGVGQGGMAELANNAMSLRAKMMLGQVGEYDMLYYSMMPNYYAALMNGVTGPELAKIYEQDLKSIGDPSMRYVVGQAIGGQNAYAMVNTPYFGAQYRALKYTSDRYEGLTNSLEFGYMRSRADVASKDIGKRYTEIVRTARNKDTDFFNDPNTFIEGQNGNWFRRQMWNIYKYNPFTAPFAYMMSPDGKDPVEKALDREDLKKVGGNWTFIIQLPDGTELGRAAATADELYMNGWQQFVGG